MEIVFDLGRICIHDTGGVPQKLRSSGWTNLYIDFTFSHPVYICGMFIVYLMSKQGVGLRHVYLFIIQM